MHIYNKKGCYLMQGVCTCTMHLNLLRSQRYIRMLLRRFIKSDVSYYYLMHALNMFHVFTSPGQQFGFCCFEVTDEKNYFGSKATSMQCSLEFFFANIYTFFG